jgi:pSer/pThr/pTyr-binding forkhead associated (FHA) protein
MVMDVRDETGLPADFIPLRLVLKASGTTVDLTRPDMILGRHSAADIRLPLPDVSRRHCRFHFEEGAWHVEDLKSLNGTFVNEQAVEQALVCHGDTLRIGGFIFSVDLGGEKKRDNGEPILSITRALPAPKVPRQAG